MMILVMQRMAATIHRVSPRYLGLQAALRAMRIPVASARCVSRASGSPSGRFLQSVWAVIRPMAGYVSVPDWLAAVAVQLKRCEDPSHK